MRQTSDVLKMFSCVGLDCEIRAHFFVLAALTVNGLDLTQIPLFFYAHTDLTDPTEFFF